MFLQLDSRVAAVAVFAGAAMFAASAFAQDSQDVLKRRHHRQITHSGEIYVHRAGRSYLDPGTSAVVGTQDRYSSDSRPYSFSLVGSPLAAHSGSWDLLPNQFTAPGRDSPLFQF
jgi:hypothetical protein